jgi:hypothetical protein
MMKLRAVLLALVCSSLLSGCGSDDDSSGSGLVGSWLLTSIQVGTTSPATCPAEIDIGGYILACGDDDELVLRSNGSYSSSLDQIPTTSGVWETVSIEGADIIIFEDEDSEDDPQSYLYDIDGDFLAISKSVFDIDVTLVFDRL